MPLGYIIKEFEDGVNGSNRRGKMIIALVNDLNFQELIEKSFEAEKAKCLVIAEEEILLAALNEVTPEALLIDIGLSTLDGTALIQKLKQNPATRSIPIVAFGNQLRADLMQDAKEMGADLVLPKSAFREQLPELIRHYDKQHK
jgi:PleD family two-component response regulator